MESVASIGEPARQTPVYGEYEVVVLGGGPAGIAAAAAAARRGARTLLVERYGFLGGMGTAAGVTNFCGLTPTCTAPSGRSCTASPTSCSRASTHSAA